MMQAIAIFSTVILLGLGAADFWLMEKPHAEQLTKTEQQTTASISTQAPVKKGVAKKQDINMDEIFYKLGIAAENTTELAFLPRMAKEAASAQTKVLMYDNDRAGLLCSLTSPDAKEVYRSLKTALQQSFSPQMRDLSDQTITPDNSPPYDKLSFVDPQISPERIIFIRIQTRLYELHVATDKEEIIASLIDAIIKE